MSESKLKPQVRTGLDLLMINAVRRLIVFHLPNLLSTPIPISPASLRMHSAIKRFETTDSNDIRSAFESIISASPTSTSRRFDARWGIFFIGRDDEEVLAIYIDRFGLNGAIDDNGVRFAQPLLCRWLEERFAL